MRDRGARFLFGEKAARGVFPQGVAGAGRVQGWRISWVVVLRGDGVIERG